MADPDASTDDDRVAAKPGSLKKALAEFVIVALIAAGAGGGVAIIKPLPAAAPPPSPASGGSGEPPTAPESAAAAVHGPATTSILDLPPVVTNIGSPADTWVRMEASIVFDPRDTPHPEVMAAEIATDELAFLRTVTLAQMQGPIGLENIRQDLMDRAVTRSGGKVTEFILKTLVVQ
jgi:flagellar FliL protein